MSYVTININTERLAVMNAKESHRHISSGYPIIHLQRPSESCSIKLISQVTILRSAEFVRQKITIHDFQNRAKILRNNEIALTETYFRICKYLMIVVLIFMLILQLINEPT
jgi:hypothetical protein